MPAVVPGYPFFPISSIAASALLLLVLATGFARQNWNLGLTFLCFWLFWECLTSGISAVLWSDNYDIKLYAYCDIVSRLKLITAVVRPMCTLIIVRRLYLIASLRSVELPRTREKRNNGIIEWTLGLIIPLVVAGPLYYVVQTIRFQVLEGFGCQHAADPVILTYILIYSWFIVPPLVSLTVYYPKVVWVFYRQRRDTDRFLRSNDSISRTNYHRILALASVDLLFTLPFNIANLAITVVQNGEAWRSWDSPFSFYEGWTVVHSDWAPLGVPYAILKHGSATLPQYYFTFWVSPVLAFAIFGLFGLTAEARGTYWRAIVFVGKRLGWKPAPRKSGEKHTLGTMEFSARPQESSLNAEPGIYSNFESVGAVDSSEAEYTGKSEHTRADDDAFANAHDVGHYNDEKPTAVMRREEERV